MPIDKTVIDETTQKNIDAWLQGNYDSQTKDYIQQQLQKNPQELVDAFYTHLSFGTGGLRGIMGVGTNRMNVYTVRFATQGLANYIAKQEKSSKRHYVLIGYDCRNHSREFAEETAKVLAGNGIEVFLYKELRPVALVSFGVLYKKCIAGVMITASHNPPAYNGYKVYWRHGGQVLPPHDKGIIHEVGEIKQLSDVKSVDLPHPLVHEIDEEIDSAYIAAIRNLQLYPEQNKEHGKELSIVYTNIHGGGITMVPRALNDWGFSSLSYVEEQKKPDGNFPTVKSPNPEEPATLKMGIDQLIKVKGDILMATDPDVDRVAVVVMHEGKPVSLNGNEAACIGLEHICRALTESKKMPPKAMFVKTIVTSELFKAIAEYYKGTCIDVLTGFKYIGEKISHWELEKKVDVPHHQFIFGGEESYGCLLGTHARDKDAVVTAALMSEAALHQKLMGKTLIDLLYEIYKTHGVYREKLLSLTYEGKEGLEKIQSMMDSLRKNPPRVLGKSKVVAIEDYLTHTIHYLESGKKEPLLLPKSDVLRFWLEDKTKLVVRPSGTEPKIKVYCGCFKKPLFSDTLSIDEMINVCDTKAELYLDILKKMLGATEYS